MVPPRLVGDTMGAVTVSAEAPTSLAVSEAPENTIGPPPETPIESVTATGQVSVPGDGGAAHKGRFWSADGGSTVCARATPAAAITASSSATGRPPLRPTGAHALRLCSFI